MIDKGSMRFTMSDLKFNFKPLTHALAEAKKQYTVQVGVLGKDNSRTAVVTNKKGNRVASKTPVTLTNAEIGLKHEFGDMSGNPRIYPRSFLRVPLWMHLPDEIKKVLPALLTGLTKTNVKQFFVNIGIVAEQIVQLGFRTGGYRLWRKNSPITEILKGSSSPLIDSGQLRDSISSRVVQA